MGGLLSEKFLDTNLTIPFAGPPLNTPSLQKYKRVRHFIADSSHLEFVFLSQGITHKNALVILPLSV